MQIYYVMALTVSILGAFIGYMIGWYLIERFVKPYLDEKEPSVKVIIPEEQVNHPKHYFMGGIECKDVIRALTKHEGYKGYLKGNIIKYLWREERKGGLEDIKKAKFYLEELEKM